MTKRMIIAVIAIFITWSVLDFIIHGLLLHPLYAATSGLWRPIAELNRPLLSLVTLVIAACFTTIYGRLVGQKSLASGIQYGALFGLATGASMGFGSYSTMPIPLALAGSWFLGSWVEAIAAGAIVGALVKPPAGKG